MATLLIWRFLLGLPVVGTASSTVFLGMVLVAARSHRRRSAAAKSKSIVVPDSALPPVTVLKPMHGMEPRLLENIGSFFQQDYPHFQIVIGTRSPEDTAIPAVEEVRQRYPQVKSEIIFSGPPRWPNAKVYSLERMIEASSDQFLVISDSDVWVGRDFLRNVIPPLLQPDVGLVTCLYEGIPAGDFWSLLEALGMSVEMPSGVMVADMMEGMRFALGAAIAVRRDALDAIGGIAATAKYYSDDFVLGNKVWASGYKVVLSNFIVGHALLPRPAWKTLKDQLRWMKSTRYSRPLGHVGTGLTYAMPFGLLGLISAAATGHWAIGIGLAVAGFLNRIIQSVAVGWGIIRDPRALKFCWLYPLRDLLGFLVWTASFTGPHFSWRGETYRFSQDGSIVSERKQSPPVAEKFPAESD